MALRISHQLPALTLGLFVGLILQEILLGIADILTPQISLNAAIIGLEPMPGLTAIILACWFIGGLSAGLMASLIGHSLTTGCVAGVLLMVPALMLAQVSFAEQTTTAALFTINPLIAAATGAWLAGRVNQNLTQQRGSPTSDA